MDKKKSPLKKLLRMLIWFAVAGVSFMVIVHIVMSLYLPGVLRRKIENVVITGSDSLYRCEVGKLKVNVWRGKASVKDVRISVDSTRYNELQKTGKLPGLTFGISLASGSVNGLKLFPLLFSRKIVLNSINAEDADIGLFRHYAAPQQDTVKKENIPLWKVIRPYIRGIYIDHISLNKIKLDYRHSDGEKAMLFAYDNCSARLIHIQIDSVGGNDPARVLFTEDIAVTFSNIRFHAADSLYQLKLGELGYSSMSKTATVKNFALMPAVPPAEFTRRNGQQIDIYQVEVPFLKATHLELTRLFAGNEIFADTVTVQQPSLKIFRDRTAPADTVTKYGKYPHEALANAPFTLRIPVLELSDARVNYIEKQAASHKEGNLFFEGISGTITNITNDKADIETNNHCVIDLQGLFIGQGAMTARFDFDLASEDGKYRAEAELTDLSAAAINQISVPFANMKMASGNVHYAHFTMEADNDGATGKLIMRYNDLGIELLKVNKEDGKTKQQRFLSFIANAVAVRKNNPAADGKETFAEYVFVPRTRVQPFFNLIWQTLFGGMKQIMLKGAAKNIKIGES
jgi:hypothetical protein